MAQSQSINIIPDESIKSVHVSQGDIGRRLVFNLFEGSTEYYPRDGAVVRIRGTKPSGYGYTAICTLSGNVASVDTTEGMTDEYGNILSELQITVGDTVLGTANFILSVEKNPHPDSVTDASIETAIQIETRMDAIETRMNAVEDAIEALETGDVPDVSVERAERILADANLQAEINTTNNDLDALELTVSQLNAIGITVEGETLIADTNGETNPVGSPLLAFTSSDMTDSTKIYVYVGSETGYTYGNWYYYDGSAWVSGGVYNALVVPTDTTLSVSGMPADAKVVGDEVSDLKEDLNDVSEDVMQIQKTLGTFLKSYVVTGRVKIDKNTILQSAKPQSGNYTFYKFTKNFLKFDDATKNGITLTHSADGKIILNGTATANTDFTVNLPVALTGQFYGYIAGSQSKNVYVYLRQSSSIGAQMTLASGTSNSFDRNVSNIVRYQMIILNGETFDNYELEASVEYLFNETHENNPYYFEKPTAIEQATFPIKSDVDYFLSALTTSQILLDTKFLSGKTAVRVSKTNGGDYSSILEALKSTPDYVKVYVENGTYNIVDEYKSYYGNSFWASYDGYANHASDPFYRGLWVSDDRVVECDAWAKIVWDYDGENTSVNGLFSVFATGQNATIKNAHVIFNANCRYAIHDDYAAFGGTNKFIGCIFDGTSSNGTTIGAGCGHRNTYVIKDCLFLNDGTYDISYHNTSGLGINHIIVTGCCGNGQLKFGWYGNSTEITECIASNNKFGSIACEAHNSSATNQNMRLSAWNNEVA